MIFFEILKSLINFKFVTFENELYVFVGRDYENLPVS